MRDQTQITIANIKNSARTLFMNIGYEKTSMRAIASGAGVTAGALYRFFQNKEDLYHAIFDEFIQDLLQIENSLQPDDLTVLSNEELVDLFYSRSSYTLLTHLLPQFDLMKSLLLAGKDSYIENMKHSYLTTRTIFSLGFYNELIRRNLALHSLSAKEIFVLEETAFSAVCGFVIHSDKDDIKKKDALLPYETCFSIITAGLKEKIGFKA